MNKAELVDFHGKEATATRLARLSCLLFVALLSVTLMVGFARAGRAQSVFTITGVAVDETAESVSAAQQRALIAGRRQALDRLWGRLVPVWAQANIPPLSNQQINELVQSVSFGREQTSDVRYLAVLSVDFKRDPVEQFLRVNQIPFAVARSKPVVVLPLFGQGETANLWEEPNPWRAAWARKPASDGLVEIITPLGDLADVSGLSSQQARAADLGALKSLARRYNAERVFITRAFVQEIPRAPAGDALDGQNPTAADPGLGALPAAGMAQQDPAGPSAPDAVAAPTAPPLALTVVTSGYLGNESPAGEELRLDSFRAAAGETREGLMDRAVAKIAADIEEAWKGRNLLDFDQQNLLLARVALTRLSDLVTLRNKIDSIALVVRSQPRRLSRTEAILQIDFLGDSEQFTRTLAQSDLTLGTPKVDEELQAFVHELRLSAGAVELRPVQ